MSLPLHSRALTFLYNPLCFFRSTMFIFGGFSGLLLNDVLAYSPPSCQAFSNPALCAAAGPGLRCHWGKNRCVPWESGPPDQTLPAPFCPARAGASRWAPVCPPDSHHPFMSLSLSPSFIFTSTLCVNVHHNHTGLLAPKRPIFFHENFNYSQVFGF